MQKTDARMGICFHVTGLKPRFEQFAMEPNYRKLLIDRKMINQETGELIRQKSVTPTFDFDAIKKVVDRHVANYDSNMEARALNHIVENWDSIPKRIRDLKKSKKPVKKSVDNLSNQTLAAQPTTEESQYSIRNTRKMSLKEQLSEYYKGNFRQSDSFYFGETPQILSKSGLDASSLAFNQDDFKKSTTQKHNIPRRVLNNLSNNLRNPIFSFTAGKQVAVAINDIDGDGKPVVVAIHGGHNMDRNPINIIKSIYGLNDPKKWIRQQIDGGGKFRIYDNEKTTAFLQTQGYLAAVGETSDGFWDIITEIDDGVKPGMNSLRNEDNSPRAILSRIDPSSRKLKGEQQHLGFYQERLVLTAKGTRYIKVATSF